MELLVAAGIQRSLEGRIKHLEEENTQLKQENDSLRRKVELLESQQPKATESKSTQTGRVSLLHTILQSQVSDLFMHYTGLKYVMFTVLLSMLVPNDSQNPVEYKKKRKAMREISLADQLLLVLCRLRHAFTLKDLACRYSISEQAVSDIFTGWILHMKRVFGYLSWWPHRDRIISNMPAEFKRNFPVTVAVIDCTELKTQKPSSFKIQSQCFSEYKSSTTLKSLIAVDPLGNLMYVSPLFTGSISDNEICEAGFFYRYLEKLRKENIIHSGDAIMADKGFRNENELAKLDIRINMPPFASSEVQMAAEDVALTNLIAAHRIHVERRINRIKNYQLVGRQIPTSLFPVINDIWYVCCYLTNFQDLIIQK